MRLQRKFCALLLQLSPSPPTCTSSPPWAAQGVNMGTHIFPLPPNYYLAMLSRTRERLSTGYGLNGGCSLSLSLSLPLYIHYNTYSDNNPGGGRNLKTWSLLFSRLLPIHRPYRTRRLRGEKAVGCRGPTKGGCEGKETDKLSGKHKCHRTMSG